MRQKNTNVVGLLQAAPRGPPAGWRWTAAIRRQSMAPRQGREEGGPTSLFLFSQTNIVRRTTKFIIEWPPFEFTVLTTIIGEFIMRMIMKSCSFCITIKAKEVRFVLLKERLFQFLKSSSFYADKNFVCVTTNPKNTLNK